LVTEAHVCEQLAQGRYLTAARPGVDPFTLPHYLIRNYKKCESVKIKRERES